MTINAIESNFAVIQNGRQQPFCEENKSCVLSLRSKPFGDTPSICQFCYVNRSQSYRMCLADENVMFYSSMYVDFRPAAYMPDHGLCYDIYKMSVHHTFHVLDQIQAKRYIDKKIS